MAVRIDFPTDGARFHALPEWLMSHGATKAEPTSEWELQRWHTRLGHLILYTKANNDRSWFLTSDTPGDAAYVINGYRGGQVCDLALTPKVRRKKTKRSRRTKQAHVAALMVRQNQSCFYCDCRITASPETEPGVAQATIEHLLPVNKGGPDTLDNKVLACGPCNMSVGSMGLHDKIAYRDRVRP